MEARKTEIAMGDCIKIDLERVGKIGGKMIDIMNVRVLRDRSKKRSERKKNDNGKGNRGFIFLNMNTATSDRSG